MYKFYPVSQKSDDDDDDDDDEVLVDAFSKGLVAKGR